MESNHPLPPITKRTRKKAREVSSRYLSTPSPSPFLSAPSNTHTQKIRKSPIKSSNESTDSEFGFPNENSNQNPNTPFPFNANNKFSGTQRKTAIKLFGDNGPNVPKKGRPATPFASYSPKGTILTNTSFRNGRVNPSGKSVNTESCSDTSSVVSDSEIEKCSVSSNGGFCESPPVIGSRCIRNQEGFRSSMPEADLLPSISSRRSQNDSNENHGDNSSAVCRSLNLALSSSQHNPFQNKTGRYVPSRICLPPSSKLNGEAKKGKRQEDIHMLKLLQNKYLQWRFINAKAKEAVDARTAAAEKSVHGLSVKIAEMKNDVAEKRIEVEMLKRMQDLSLILESQMPHLDKYSNLEENYCSSLTGIIKALQDCSLRLPTTENVKVDVNEIKQVFDSTMNIFNSFSPSLERIIPKTEEVKDVVSNLAEVASIERALVEECGNLLAQAHNLQVSECSLRGQLMQAKQSSKNVKS